MIGIENTILLAIESVDSHVLHTAGFVLVGIAALCRGNVLTYCGTQASWIYRLLAVVGLSFNGWRYIEIIHS